MQRSHSYNRRQVLQSLIGAGATGMLTGLGGTARAARMTPEERSESARLAAQERWRKRREQQEAERADG